MNTDVDIMQRLGRSKFYNEFKQAFGDSTGLPLTLRPLEFWQLAHRNQPHENAFCAMIAQTNRGCAVCLEALGQRNRIRCSLFRVLRQIDRNYNSLLTDIDHSRYGFSRYHLIEDSVHKSFLCFLCRSGAIDHSTRPRLLAEESKARSTDSGQVASSFGKTTGNREACLCAEKNPIPASRLKLPGA